MKQYAYISRYSANSFWDIDRMDLVEANLIRNEINEIMKAEGGQS